MKIVFFTSGSVRSNFSFRALTLAKLLSARGHEVVLVSPKADKYNHFKGEDIREIDGVRVCQPFQFRTTQAMLNLVPYLFGAAWQALMERPDVVYIYKPTPISVVGLVAKLLYKSIAVLDMDDLGSEVMKLEGHPVYQRALVKWSEDIAARCADRIVVASVYLEQMFRDKFPHKPILRMPNGVEDSWLKEPVTTSEEPHRVVFMGALNRANILEPLFDALPRAREAFPDLRVRIIGDGSYLTYFKEKAKRAGVSNCIEFLGWLPLERARAKLCMGDIGYCVMPDELPNRAASNMKVPQYMARGVVPLVSDVGDLTRTVAGGRAGYVTAQHNAAGVERALIEALGNASRPLKARAAREAAASLKWSDLASAFEAWLMPHTQRIQPLVYVVSTTVPGEVGGAETRNYHLIKQLIARVAPGLKVFTIFPPTKEEERGNYAPEVGERYSFVRAPRETMLIDLRAILGRVPPFMTIHRESGLDTLLRRACEENLPNIVHLEQLDAYYAVRPHIAWLKRRGVKIVFDCHNVEYQAFRDSLNAATPFKRLAGMFIAPRLHKLEIEATKNADLVLACSPRDAGFFLQHNANTRIVANGVDTAQFEAHPAPRAPSLVFMGGVAYPPNADALAFYLRDIHPHVKRRVPGVKLFAVGATSEWLAAQELYDDSVEPLGFVQDIRPVLGRAMVGICPVRLGSGTRIKILTYMAAGLPVVSTRKGAEGVGYTDKEHILLADEPKAFADAVASLCDDANLREKIAKGGRAFVEARYDWEVLGRDLSDAYLSLTPPDYV